MYAPAASVAAVRTSPVSVWVALTRAFRTTAPVGSSTVPRMLAVICCATTFRPANIMAAKHRTFLTLTIAFLHSFF